VTPADARKTYAILRRMQALHKRHSPPELLEMNGLLRQLLAEFVAKDPPGQSLKNEGALRFRPVLEHMDANLGAALRVTQLARMVHLEPTYFSHVFARHFGLSPIQCLIRKRIEKAQGLLLQGDEKLESLAARLGFRDAFHFSKTFKRVTGLSPSCFRVQRKRTIP
jgi:transcriptional regulator GlxA family with amidase domain